MWLRIYAGIKSIHVSKIVPCRLKHTEAETEWTPFRRRHFKCIFLDENIWIAIYISLRIVPKGSINNITALVQIMAWRRPGDKPLSEPMMVRLPTHICVTRPRRVNTLRSKQIAHGISKFIGVNNDFVKVHCFFQWPYKKQGSIGVNSELMTWSACSFPPHQWCEMIRFLTAFLVNWVNSGAP